MLARPAISALATQSAVKGYLVCWSRAGPGHNPGIAPSVPAHGLQAPATAAELMRRLIASGKAATADVWLCIAGSQRHASAESLVL